MKKVLKSEDFYIQNDYIDNIMINPEKHCYEEIIFYSLFVIDSGYLLDYLLLNCGVNKKSDELKIGLIKYGIYNSYLKNVAECDDDFLKAHLVLYLENDLLYSIFNDEYELANAIINNEYCDERYKIYDLMTLSEFKCNEDTITLIKDNVLKYINSYDKSIGKDDLEIIKIKYLNQIDENQSYFKNSYVYENKN